MKTFMLSLALAVVSGAVFLQAPASFAKTPASLVRVLSYDEVMHLSKEKRAAYIGGLRAMLIEIDRLPKNLRSSNGGPSRASEIANLLLLFSVPEASAADPLPYVGEKGITCGAGYTARVPVAPRVGINGQSIDPNAYVCIVGKRQSSKCASGLIPVRQDADGSFECATSHSFYHIPKPLQSNARKPHHFDTFFGHSTKNFTDGYPSTESLSAAARAAPPVTAPPVTVPLAQKVPAKPAVKPAAAKPAAPAATTGVPLNPPDAVRTAAAPKPPLPKATHQLRGTEVKPPPEVKPPSDVITVVPVSPELKACEPTAEKTCDASAVEQARRQYASDADPDCIYAGGISTYQDGKKRAYGCVAPSKFCFGSTTCKSSAGEPLTADYSCETNQVICNPLVFGVHGDGKSPFCIDKTPDATAMCDQEAESDEKAITPLDQTHAGLKEAWNDFADRLFTLCNKNKVAAQLHCAECEIISKHLFALNAASRDVKSCGAAMKYEDANCDADGNCKERPGAKTATGNRARGISSVEVETPSRDEKTH